MNLFSRLRLSTKLSFLLGMSALAIVVSIALGADTLHRRMIDDRIDKLRTVVEMTISLARPLAADVVARRLTEEQAYVQFRAEIHALRFDDGRGYLTWERDDYAILGHGTDPRREGMISDAKDSSGTKLNDLIGEALKDHDAGIVTYSFPKPGQTVPLVKLSYVARFAPWHAVIIAGAWTDDLDADYHATLFHLIPLAGSILLVTLVAAWLINSDISGSLGALRAAMRRLAAGERDTAIPGTSRRDEVGEMAQSLLVFEESMIETERLRAAQDELKRQATAGQKAAMGQMADVFEGTVGRLVAMLSAAFSELASTAESMTGSANQSKRDAASVAEQGAATSEIARSVQQTSQAAHDVTVGIGGVSQSTSDTGAAAIEVQTASVDLSKQAELLASEVHSFLAGVRAA